VQKNRVRTESRSAQSYQVVIGKAAQEDGGLSPYAPDACTKVGPGVDVTGWDKDRFVSMQGKLGSALTSNHLRHSFRNQHLPCAKVSCFSYVN
jgi:hypothetical protein